MKKINLSVLVPPILVLAFLLPAEAIAEKDSWYFMANYQFGLSSSYSNEINSSLQQIGATNRKISGYEYGFYWNLGFAPKIYLGAAVPMRVEKYTTSQAGAPDSITCAAPGLSMIYSFGESPASGLFLRFDLGYGVVNRPGDYFAGTLLAGSSAKMTDEGLGYLIGAGWGMPVSDAVAIVPIVTYFSIKGRETYSFFAAGLGIAL
jgi:hypothetical protein